MPTSPDNIPTINTSVDAPSGLGINAIVQAVQTALSARPSTPAGIAAGEAMIWNGSTFVRSSVTKLSISSLSGFPNDATQALKGDGTWGQPPDFEIGYDQVTSGSIAISGTTQAAPTTVITSSSYTFDGSPVIAEVFFPEVLPGTAVGAALNFGIYVGGASVANLGIVQNATASTFRIPTLMRLRFAPAAGARIYTIGVWATGGTTGAQVVTGVGTGGAAAPGYLRFTKV
ncbi:MAG TPA: hypothetical protein VJ741_05740 [Solirubrobacteraceae bacterium]|nr:hypothetical protein [Solirubrobacteraceae bacterium]